MKWLDLPPVWLAAFLAAAWGISGVLPGLAVDAAWLRWLGAMLVGAGLGLMMLAVLQMAKHRTTVIPHRQPTALVSTGVFRISRNPIYLGDALILTGTILWWGAVAALPLVVGFIWLISLRFISPEEARLRAGFGEDFADWSERTRRWL